MPNHIECPSCRAPLVASEAEYIVCSCCGCAFTVRGGSLQSAMLQAQPAPPVMQAAYAPQSATSAPPPPAKSGWLLPMLVLVVGVGSLVVVIVAGLVGFGVLYFRGQSRTPNTTSSPTAVAKERADHAPIHAVNPPNRRDNVAPANNPRPAAPPPKPAPPPPKPVAPPPPEPEIAPVHHVKDPFPEAAPGNAAIFVDFPERNEGLGKIAGLGKPGQ